MAGRDILSGDGYKVTLAHLQNTAEWTQVYPSTDLDRSDVVKRYKDVPWLFRGVEYRAQSVAQLPFVWLRGDEELEDSREERERLGLPEFDPATLLNVMEGWRTLYGSAYVWKDVRGGGRAGDGMRPMHPGTIEPVIDNQAGLTGWKRTLKNETKRYQVDDLVYSWVPARDTEIGPGTPPVEAALSAAGVLHHTALFGSAFFEKGTIMPTLISVIDGMAGDEELTRLQAFLKRTISGVRNAFRMQALSKSVEINQLGQPMKDLAMADLTVQAREDVAILRLERLYPFPGEELRGARAAHDGAGEIVWVQEEPANMGAWSHVRPRLREIAGDGVALRYAGRSEMASPAEGYASEHEEEQRRIVETAFGGASG